MARDTTRSPVFPEPSALFGAASLDVFKDFTTQARNLTDDDLSNWEASSM